MQVPNHSQVCVVYTDNGRRKSREKRGAVDLIVMIVLHAVESMLEPDNTK